MSKILYFCLICLITQILAQTTNSTTYYWSNVNADHFISPQGYIAEFVPTHAIQIKWSIKASFGKVNFFFMTQQNYNRFVSKQSYSVIYSEMNSDFFIGDFDKLPVISNGTVLVAVNLDQTMHRMVRFTLSYFVPSWNWNLDEQIKILIGVLSSIVTCCLGTFLFCCACCVCCLLVGMTGCAGPCFAGSGYRQHNGPSVIYMQQPGPVHLEQQPIYQTPFQGGYYSQQNNYQQHQPSAPQYQV